MTMTHSRTPGHRPTFNVFRHKANRGLECAVSELTAVPVSITAEHWEYDRRVVLPGDVPPGFDPQAALTSASIGGSYYFRNDGYPHRRRPGGDGGVPLLASAKKDIM
jgi:hypothetical protein